jgi:hypothetical protein
MLLGRAPERRRCAGRSAGVASPCAALRELRLPRHPRGLAPLCLEVRAVGPLRACHPSNTSRIFVSRRTRSEMSSGPSPVSWSRKARWPPYRGIEAGVPSLRPAYKRPLAEPLAHAAARAGGTAYAPHRGAAPSGQYRRRPTRFAAALDPLQPPCAALGSFQAGSSLEQSPPRLCSRCAVGRPAASAHPPIRGHKSTFGKPLIFPHPFPGQGRHRSRPISASRTVLHAQGLHCLSLVLSKVFFVNQGPICDRNKSSRGLPVKPSLK